MTNLCNDHELYFVMLPYEIFKHFIFKHLSTNDVVIILNCTNLHTIDALAGMNPSCCIKCSWKFAVDVRVKWKKNYIPQTWMEYYKQVNKFKIIPIYYFGDRIDWIPYSIDKNSSYTKDKNSEYLIIFNSLLNIKKLTQKLFILH